MKNTVPDTPMETGKLRLLYVYELMRRTDEWHPLNVTQIGAALEAAGYPAERKAIMRDLRALVDFGCSILKCEDHNKGFYMVDQRFETYELKLLADAVASARFLSDSDSRQLIGKLCDQATKEGANLIRRTTHIDPQLKTDDRKNKLKIDCILQALMARRQISFQYLVLGKDGKQQLKHDGKTYIVSPFFLTTYTEEYFLVAYEAARKQTVHFRVEMMTNVKLLNTPSCLASDVPELEQALQGGGVGDYLRQRVNLWNGDVVRVTLRCDNAIRHHIRVKFGKQLMEREQTGTHFTVDVSVTDAQGFYQWLAQFGSQIELVSPQEQRQKCRQFLENALSLYTD